MPLKLHLHPVSQPSRAILIICAEGKIPHEVNVIALEKGAHKTPEFAKLNPNQSIPVLEEEDGFLLWESHAILKYLVAQGKLEERFYPTDLRTRATIDKWLDWHHTNTRPGAAGIFREVVFGPMFGKTPDQKVIEQKEAILNKALSILEAQLEKTVFLAGDNVSLADIAIVCELRQNQVSLGESFAKYPKVAEWIAATRKAVPSFEAVEQPLIQFAAAMAAKKQEQK